MKTYQIQTFFIDWTYKDTINPNDILNEISFSSNIDWWPWELRINTTYKINELQYGGGEYLRVTLFDDFHKEGIQIYYWYISQIIRQIDSSREYTTLVCLWVSSLLKNILFTNWSYTKTPSEMIKDVLTYFGGFYTCISEGTIWKEEEISQNYNRENKTCLDVIKSVCEGAWYKFFIDGEWKLNVFDIWNEHLLHLHYDVEKMTITDTIESVVNAYTLQRNGGTIQTYESPISILNYWRKEKFENNTEINSANTQDVFWNQFILDNQEMKETMSLTLNTHFPFEDIKPWDRITVLNAWIEITNKIVNRVSYKSDECVLTIDKTDTLRSVIE